MFPCRWPLEGGAEEALKQADGQSFRANAERGARPLAMFPTIGRRCHHGPNG